MKRIIFLLFLMMLTTSAIAQSYDELWKQVNTHINADHPKSAIAEVEKIRDKAAAEPNDAQLLRATLTLLVLDNEVSPDSAEAIIARMEESLSREERPVVQALWHCALAKVYDGLEYRTSWMSAATCRRLKQEHMQAALSDPALLASTGAGEYMPLFTRGADSRYFGNDLLHIFYGVCCDEAASDDVQRLLRQMVDVYAARGNRDAVLLLSLDSLARAYGRTDTDGPLEKNEYFSRLQALAREHKDNPLNLLTYECMTQLEGPAARTSALRLHNDSLRLALAEEGVALYGKKAAGNGLRNFIMRMKTPTAEISNLPETYYPGERAAFTLSWRNLRKVSLRITRVYDSDIERRNDELKQRNGRSAISILAEKNRHASTLQDFALEAAAPCQWSETELQFTAPAKPGIYYIEMLGEGRVLSNATLQVSALQTIVFAYPTRQNRMTIVDSRTGHPVAGARIVEYAYDSGQWRQKRVYNTDSNATVTITDKQRSGHFFAMTDADKASGSLSTRGMRDASFYEASNPNTTLDLFTDRAIYRPGQQVHFSGVAYSRLGDSIHTEPGFGMEVQLYNVNDKLIDSLLVKTDDFGTFSGTFVLPEEVLNGTFRLFAQTGGVSGSRYFKVEEYKRPTFTTETEPVSTAYCLGDTVSLCGKARTYTDVPVGGAKVRYTVERMSYYYWRHDNEQTQSGETVTDTDGRFTIPVQLLPDEDEEPDCARRPRYFYVKYTVTSDTGESAEGSATLHAARTAAWLEHHIPSEICRKAGKPIKPFSVCKMNASGHNMEAAGTYVLTADGGAEVERGTFVSGKPFVPAYLQTGPEGIYSLRLEAGSDAAPDTVRIVLISTEMRKSVDRSRTDFSYTDYNADGYSVRVMFGTTRADVMVLREILAENKLIQSDRFVLTDSLLNETYTYRPEYGAALKVCYAFVFEGRLYTHTAELRKPEPKKQLTLHWNTFRSRLTPGQHEQWQLQVSMPDGTPAAAQVLACMYDASLDALAHNSFGFSNLSFYRPGISTEWGTSRTNSEWSTIDLSGSFKEKYLNAPNVWPTDFTGWRTELFIYGRIYGKPREMILMSKSMAIPMEVAVESCAAMDSDALSEASVDAEMQYELSARKVANAGSGAASFPAQQTSAAAPRKNFAETAFFMPALRTNDKGEATIDFTLPESTTEWHFKALAHTRQMHYGVMDTSVVARKDFMVQPALPRFVRTGDSTALPIQVSNLSDETVDAVLTLQLTDAVTQQMVLAQKQQVQLRAGEVRVVSFDYRVGDESSLLVCRAMAESARFSDGEEHYLPVLSSEVEVTRTLPFSLTAKGSVQMRVDTLFNSQPATHRRLTVELSSNPTWYAVSALPSLAGDASSVSADDWATRFYALALGRCVGAQNPEIASLAAESPDELTTLSKVNLEGLTDLTPWLKNAAEEERRSRALRELFDEAAFAARKHTALAKLSDLQTEKGGWSWYPGMPASCYITVDVAMLLARVEKLTDERDAHPMLTRAIGYLESEIARQVSQMKRYEKKNKNTAAPSEFQLRYLYVRTLMGLSLDGSDCQYLLERAEKMQHELTMYGKAVMAVVLARSGRKAEAQSTLQSLIEHTVSKEGMGRYFDTQRAEMSWNSYRIPTQCAAIEALQYFGKDSMADELRLWLVQAKRTQMWETSRASSDAVYALLLPASESKAVQQLGSTEPLYYTLMRGKKIVGLNAHSQTDTPNTANYYRRTYTDEEAVRATELKLRKSADGLAWGSVYATFTAPASEVQTEGKGLQLDCSYEVKRPDGWQPMAEGTALEKGDRVRRVFTVTADRDYDFVSIRAERAACMEPGLALSGYQWNDGLPAYRVVRDASTEYFIEQVSKGRHTFTEELSIDRAGAYTTGISKISCVYAPEFCGTAAEQSLLVK